MAIPEQRARVEATLLSSQCLSSAPPIPHLFDVQKVFGFKVDGRSLHGTFLIQCTTVADIGTDSKCDWLVLQGGERKPKAGVRGRSAADVAHPIPKLMISYHPG